MRSNRFNRLRLGEFAAEHQLGVGLSVLLVIAGLGLFLLARAFRPETPPPPPTYIGPTPTVLARTEVIAPDESVITQWGYLIEVRGGDPPALTLDTPDHGPMTFTVSAGTQFYFEAGKNEILPYTGDALALLQQVAQAHSEISIAYAGTPGKPERTLAVLFQTGFDAAALPAGTPSYVAGGGDVTISEGGIVNTTGRIVELEIAEGTVRLTLDARGAEPLAFEFDLAAVDLQVLRAGNYQTAADPAPVLADAQTRGLTVSIATQEHSPPRVIAVLIQDR